MELCRFLTDDFVIQQGRNYAKEDFTHKREKVSSRKIGKRQYLDDSESKKLMRRLNLYFEKKVEVPRIRVGERQTLETLINEEALLFAKHLRNEKDSWKPRIPTY
jgi:CRISPR/Cas system-associated endonuclease Cas1